MDALLTCNSCHHAIGFHSSDGCSSMRNFGAACACTLNAGDVVNSVLKQDEEYRARLLSEPFRFRQVVAAEATANVDSNE